MGTFSLIAVLGRRALRRTECKLAITIALLFVLVASIESCLRFYGADVGELPSAAYGWAWNMDAMQVNASRVYLHFVMPIAAALVFSDAARQDLRSGSIGLLARRLSVTSCFGAYGAVSFLGGFALTFFALALLQLVALVAFPAQGVFEGYLGMPMYLDLRTSGALMQGLWDTAPYVYNLVFALWASIWSGLSALLSFSLGVFLRKSKISLLLPAVVSLVAFIVFPLMFPGAQGLLHFAFAYPHINDQVLNPAYFVVMPLLYLLPSAALMLVACRRGRGFLI